MPVMKISSGKVDTCPLGFEHTGHVSA
jgi:hypothetical protein